MTNRKKQYQNRNWKTIRKELQGVDILFETLAKDKRLPTFGEFFLNCLVMGNAECVNLKKLYPQHYEGLSAWLKGQK